MDSRLSDPILRKIVIRILVALGIVAHAWPAHADEGSIEALKARTDGVYILEEWHKDGQVYRPPQVEGRFVLLNGVIITILHNKMQPPNEITVVVIGRYTLDSAKFSYGYDNTSIFTEGSSGVTVSHKPLFEGLRNFAVNSEGGVVRMRSETGQQELLFDASGSTYSENGKPLRVWRRTTER